jgi:1-phosphofructokinase
MILCVTPNPAVDRALIVPGFLPGEVFRSTQTLTIAAGKGVSLARAAQTLGADVCCSGFLGGRTGEFHRELLAHEGIRTAWTRIEAETRTCIIIADPNSGKSTVVNEPGPTVNSQDWQRLHDDILREAAHADYVCFSGSVPPGSSLDLYGSLIRELCAAGHPVWVDSSGEALRTALAAAPTGIKVNGAEIGALLGMDVNDSVTAFRAASRLRQMGIDNAVVTLGELGAVMANASGEWCAQPPRVQVICAVGSGDAFFAGLISSLAANIAPDEALRRAVAAGAANALSLGAGRFTRQEFDSVLAGTVPGS